MSSKLDFLKRYEDRGTINKRKGKRKKSNFYVVDDDVNWKSTLIHAKSELKCEEDSDEAPLVAEVRDESVLKWQPLSIPEEKTSAIQDTAKKRKKHEGKSKPSTIGISETYDSDLSPPRDSRGVMEDCGSLKNDHQDLSPPRKAQKVVDNTLPFDDLSPPRRVCNSKNTYGHPRTDEAELELKDYRSRKQDNHSERYLKGCNATGKHSHHKERKISIDHNRAQEDQEDHAEKKKNDEEFMQWGRGVAQTKTMAEKIQDEEYEMSKPLARFADDEDLEKMLKERLRDGDPMLMFTKKTKSLATNRKQGKLQFEGKSALNRFGIYPGYRWDGVNRSNGFEKAWFSKSSNNKAIQEESYKWSVEDM